MKIRINKTIGVVLVVLGLLDLCLFLTFLVETQKLEISCGLSSLVAIGIGLLFLMGIYFEVSQNSLTLKAFVGTAHTVYPLASPRDLGQDVYLIQNGSHQKLPIYSWIADKRDWEVFAKWLRGEMQSSKE